MTTLNEAREAVYLRFTTNFTALTSDRITLDNEDFTPPDTGSWVRVAVRTSLRNQNTLGQTGNRKFRTTARVLVQVYTQPNNGVQQGDTLARAAAIIFEGVSFSGLDFRAVDVRETGLDGRWYGHLVEAPFDYDEIK